MVRVDAGGRSGRTAAVAKPSRSDFALKVALGNSYAARHSGVLRLVSATQPLSVGDYFGGHPRVVPRCGPTLG